MSKNNELHTQKIQIVNRMASEGDSFGLQQQPISSVSHASIPQQQPLQVQIPFWVVEEHAKLMNQNMMTMKQLEKLQLAHEEAKCMIANLKNGIYGSDWHLWQDEFSKRIWMKDGKKEEILMDAIVKKVRLYTVFGNNVNIFFYEIIFERLNGTIVTICMSQRELYSSSSMLQELEKGGLYIRVKRSNIQKCQLLRRLFAEKIDETNMIPFFAGWEDQIFLYCHEEGRQKMQQLGICIPYACRCFMNEAVDPREIKREVESIFMILQKDAAVLLSLVAGSILYTQLKRQGFFLDAVFALDESYTANLRKWLQPWEREICAEFSSKKSLLKNLFESKDETIFLLDNGTDYSLRFDFLLRGIGNSEIVKDNQIVPLNAVPVLITNRFKIWQKRGIPLLRLPCQEPKKIRAKKAVVSHFWKGYCDNLNKEYDFWQERLTSLQMPQYNGEMFLNTYAWLVAAYSVLYPYLSTVMGDANLNLLSVTEFASYVDEWLCNIEKQNDLDASEEFIYKLHCLKEEGIIEFVKPQQYEKKTDGKIVMAVDEKFVYISRNDFTDVVQRILPGCTEREVYEKLVEADYAKVGDSGHCFPKCSQNAGFSDGRKRMVHIRRELLLTEEELLLEV